MPDISGYAALFGVETVIGDSFREKLAPGCFSRSLKHKDIRALLDHDTGRILGRTSAGTLTLREDRAGLYFNCELDETTPEGQTAIGAIGRHDLSGMSFGFRVLAEEWQDGGTRLPVRTIKDMDLYEVSVVAFPAYDDTSVVLSSVALSRSSANAANASRRRAEAAMRRRGIPV